jgi:hypothetical protein
MDSRTATSAVESPVPLLFDETLFVRMARLYAGSCGVAFLAAVLLSAYWPAAGSYVVGGLFRFHRATLGLLDSLIPWPWAVILLGNLKGAATASVLGLLAAALLGRVYCWEDRQVRPPQYGWPGRASYAVVAAGAALGQRLLPGVSRPADLRVRLALAVAALVPVAVVTLNGLLIGIYLAHSLLHGWTTELAAAIAGSFPHGVFELPALFLAGATGLNLADRLAAHPELSAATLAPRARELLLSAPLLRTAALLLALVLAGAGLEALFLG